MKPFIDSFLTSLVLIIERKILLERIIRPNKKRKNKPK